jgi:hypothetical protein
MTEDTKGHALDIIAHLMEQGTEIEKLVSEAMWDYSDGVEADDPVLKTTALNEMERYTQAYAEVRKAAKILKCVREGIE